MTNWVGPNPAAVVAMLNTVGFNRVEIVWREPLWRRLGRFFKRKGVRTERSRVAPLQQGRLVVHAFKR